MCVTDYPFDDRIDIDASVAFLIRSRVRAVISETLSSFGIEVENIDAYIADTAIRNDLIRSYYARGRAAGVKAERLICIMADAFHLSYGLVYDIVHRNRVTIMSKNESNNESNNGIQKVE